MMSRSVRLVTVLCALFIGQGVLAEEAAIDYAAARMELAASPDYSPYLIQLMHNELLGRHHELAQDPDTTIEEINQPLAELESMYPLGIQVNYTVAEFLEYVAWLLEEQGEAQPEIDSIIELADSKRRKADAILESILVSGDGNTPESAYVVINIVEEYAVLDHFGFRITSQSLLRKDGNVYDLIVGTAEDGTERDFYFDVTSFVRE